MRDRRKSQLSVDALLAAGSKKATEFSVSTFEAEAEGLVD
jgi:hypothetical protein